MNLDKISERHYDNLDDYLDVAETVSNDEPIENLFGRKKKKRKGRLKKIFNKVKKGVKKAAQKLGNAAKFAVLLPLMPSMIAVLKAKGKRVPKAVEDISQAFYQAIINKNYDENFERLSIGEKMSFEPATISIIVQAIIKFFKKLKQRKKEGKKLTSTEAIALGTAAVEATKITLAAEKDIARDNRKAAQELHAPETTRTGESSSNKMNIMPVIIAAVAAIFLLKK